MPNGKDRSVPQLTWTFSKTSEALAPFRRRSDRSWTGSVRRIRVSDPPVHGAGRFALYRDLITTPWFAFPSINARGSWSIRLIVLYGALIGASASNARAQVRLELPAGRFWLAGAALESAALLFDERLRDV